MSLYTTSRIRTWRDCPRKHEFRYELGALAPSTPAMSFGTDGHGVLEAWYRAWMRGCAACEGKGEVAVHVDATHLDRIECEECRGSGFNPADRTAAAFAAIDAADLSDIDRAKLRVLAAAYDARWGGEPWEVLAVEAEFRYWLGDVEMGGKLDALVRDTSTGAVYVVEHKFTASDFSPGSPYWAKLELDTQISVYHDGAATAFDVEIAGCVYDVLKRPQHELRLATPIDARKYTVGKGCRKCGGSAKPGSVERGKGTYTVTFTTVEIVTCDDCHGTGWKKDKDGVPEAPRLHSNQRTEDETLDEFTERLSGEIAERPDDFLARSVIVRLGDELPRMRQELIDTVSAMRVLADAKLAPPNHGACSQGRDMCGFFEVCAGRASITDFPRGAVHAELPSAQQEADQAARDNRKAYAEYVKTAASDAA